jgi:hypothetical protein
MRAHPSLFILGALPGRRGLVAFALVLLLPVCLPTCAYAFAGAIIAKQGINWNGQNALVDSFDSSDPAHSSNGLYAVDKAKDNGNVAVNASITNVVSTGNQNIYGHVFVGPGGTVAPLGIYGGIGEHTWQSIHPGQIEPGWFNQIANFALPNQVLPYSASSPGVQFPLGGVISSTNCTVTTNVSTSSTYSNPPPSTVVVTNLSQFTTTNWTNVAGIVVTNCGNIIQSTKGFPAEGTYCVNPPPWQTGSGWSWYGISSYSFFVYTYTYYTLVTNCTTPSTTYDYILYDGDYYLANAAIGQTLVLGHARLVLPYGINMGVGDSLTIFRTGSLQMYVDKNSHVGGSGIQNQSGFVINCEIFCTANVTSFDLFPNGQFTGVLVAPEAAVTLLGYGGQGQDFIGALVANSVMLTGDFRFHFDEALGPHPSAFSMLRPRLSTGLSGETQFQFDISDNLGSSFIIQTSSNLLDWSPAITNIAPFTFTDPGPADLPIKYYRAVYQH